MTKRTAEAQRTQVENGAGPALAHLMEPLLAGMTTTRQDLLAWVHAQGLAALDEVFREEAAALVGAKGRHQPERTHHHWGTAPTKLTFGGRRVQVQRPRVRRTTGGEATLPSVAAFRDRDPLTARMNPIQLLSSGGSTALLTGLGIDEFFVSTEAGGQRTLLTDALGSTIAELAPTAVPVAEYSYGPFGQTFTPGVPGTPFQYTGRENDGTGLYYYRARYYHPGLQRLISEDPIGFESGDTNLYAYVSNNPLHYVDPLGLDKQDRSCIRLPDYISANVNVAIPTPWTGTVLGWSGVVAVDRHGGIYWSPVGASAGKAFTGVSGSLTGSWLNQCAKPTEGQLENFLTAHGFSVGGGFIGGGGVAYTPGAGTATQLGLYSPQIGVSYNYSWKWGTTHLRW